MIKKPASLLWTLLAAALLFIWGNSLLPPSYSWKLSGMVQGVVEQVLPVEQADERLEQPKGFTVRKLAHMGEFALLGALLGLLTGAVRRCDRVPLALLLGLSTALADETIQRFTGRTSSVIDVWVDMGGFLFGLLLTWLVMRWRSSMQDGG